MRYHLLPGMLCWSVLVQAQTPSTAYPVPEFINEVYLLKKDSNRLVRLEKNNAVMETKMKLGGFGGAEAGYFLEGEKSSVHLSTGIAQSFVYYLSTAGSDSTVRRSSGYPAPYAGVGTDPLDQLRLQSFTTGKNKRKLLLSSMQGTGKQKQYSFGVRKIREGYYELLPEKPLPKGEYAFVVRSMASADGGVTLFCFSVE